MKTTIPGIFLIFALVVLPRFSQSNQGNQDWLSTSEGYLYCTLPLTRGNTWQYDVYKAGNKVGQITKTITGLSKLKPEKRETWQDDNFGYSLFTMKVNDTYKRRQYTKQLLADYSHRYIYTKRITRPYLPTYMSMGDQVGNMLVVSIEDEPVPPGVQLPAAPQGTKKGLATLEDLDGKSTEKYMGHVGLVYYKKGDIEYKLTSAKLKDVNVEGCQEYLK